MATLITGVIVAVIIFTAARQLYRDKKNGKSLCGGKCSCCPNGCACHGEINGKLNQAITFSIEDIGGDEAGAMVMCYK